MDPRRQDGFTMVLAIAAMFLVTIMCVAAFAAVQGDQPLVENDSLQKQAYAAAQAGVQQYLFDLDSNNQFWTQCATGGNGVNLAGSITSTRYVPGSSTEKYAIELMPANGNSACSTTNATATMITSAGVGAGSIRIRVTGYAGTIKRTIVAVLRESTFLDYLWFTKYETPDPQDQLIAAGCTPSSCPNSSWSTALASATSQCAQYYVNGRLNAAFYTDSSSVAHYCSEVYFAGGDNMAGPMYTDDAFAVCGSPTFGSSSSDPIMIGASSTYGETTQGASSCTASANNKGTVTYNAPQLSPPATDSSLATVAGVTYYGPTCFIFGSGTYQTATPQSSKWDCTNTNKVTWTTHSYPSNGVIYVANSTSSPCTLTYDHTNPDYYSDTANSGCGTAYVNGTYNTSLTLAAANDIVVDGSITYSGSASLLGLVANGWVRVYHTCSSGSNLGNLTIDAAMMSVQHSFIVDDYNCGGVAGSLTVYGSIGQLFRGSMGTTNTSGTLVNGYSKSFSYDTRLEYQEPPDFLDPVTAAWHVVRQDECTAGGALPAGASGTNSC